MKNTLNFTGVRKLIWYTFLLFYGGVPSAFTMETKEDLSHGEGSKGGYFHLQPFENIPSVPGKFFTGKELWEEGKLYFRHIITDQNRLMHERFSKVGVDDFLLNLGVEKKLITKTSLKYCPAIRAFNTLEDLSVSLIHLVDYNSLAPLALFVAFNQAVVDILTITNEAVQKSLYVKQDLLKLEAYFKEVIQFFKRSEYLINDLYGNPMQREPLDPDPSHKKPFPATYVEAKNITLHANNYLKKVRNDFEGIIGIYDYINFHSQLYYMMFQNQYGDVKAHLDERENKETLRYLNRPHKGALHDFHFNLMECSLPDANKLEAYQNKVPEFSLSEPGEKKRRVKKKKRAHRQKQMPQPQPGSLPLSTETIRVDLPSLEMPDETEKKEGKQEGVGLIPEIRGQEQPLYEDKVSAHDRNDPHHKAQSNLQDQERCGAGETICEPKRVMDASSSLLNKAIVNNQMELKKIVYKAHQLSGLDKVLAEFDGGAHKGMKTRHFLRLAQALNSLGHFSSFSATNKEVRVNISPDEHNPQGFVSAMHTGHSKRHKEKNITGPTARKMNEVIALLKEKDEGGKKN